MAKAESDRIAQQPQSRGFPFDPADLRLVAAYCSDPLTRAIRNHVLGFRSPAWSDEARTVLARMGESRSDAVAVAIRRKALCFVETPNWSQGVLALESTFALNRRLHLFRSQPAAMWTTFLERQLTKGLAYFLNADDPTAQIGRVRALLKALGAAHLSNDISEVTVTPEAPTSGNKYIDLLIEWQDASELRYAVAIEAKLGHRVTTGQLRAYRNHLRNVPNERRLLLVVSPRFTAHMDRSLRQNPDWSWMAWRDLLVAHERSLRDEDDDSAYRQFRRTLWDQTG